MCPPYPPTPYLGKCQLDGNVFRFVGHVQSSHITFLETLLSHEKPYQKGTLHKPDLKDLEYHISCALKHIQLPIINYSSLHTTSHTWSVNTLASLLANKSTSLKVSFRPSSMYSIAILLGQRLTASWKRVITIHTRMKGGSFSTELTYPKGFDPKFSWTLEASNRIH